MTKNVFISHTRQNSNIALRLSEALQRRELKPWVDLSEIGIVQDWRQKVTEAIRNADGFVFLLGPEEDRGQSFEMQKILEQEYDTDPSKAMIPVVLGKVEMPGFLKSRKAIKLSSPDVESLADKVAAGINHPESTIDFKMLEGGRQAWKASVKRQLEDALKRAEREEAKRARLLKSSQQ